MSVTIKTILDTRRIKKKANELQKTIP